MSDDVIRLAIEIDPDAAIPGLNKFDQAGKRVFDNIQKGTQNTKTAVVQLSHAFRDIPYAIGNPTLLVGPFDKLIQTFTTLKQETGSTKGALASLGQSLSGGGGILLAVTGVISALAIFSGDLLGNKSNAEADKKAIDELGKSMQSVKSDTEQLSSALQFQNKLGAINLEIIFGKGSKKQGFELSDLREQSMAQQQFVLDLGSQTARAYQNYQKAIELNSQKATEETIKGESDALAAFRAAQQKELDARQQQAILYRQIQLQKNKDQEELNNEAIENEKKHLEAERKIIEQAKKIQDELGANFLIDRIGNLQSLEQQLKKAKVILHAFENTGFKVKIPLLEIEADKFKIPQLQNKNLIGPNPKLIIALDSGQKELDRIRNNAESAAKTIDDALTPAVDNLFEAFLSGNDPLKAFFDGLIQGIEAVIKKLIEAALEAAIFSAITGGASGGGVSFGQAFAKILGFRAGGGSVIGGGAYIVGEKGPELFVPGSSGNIIPNGGSAVSTSGVGRGSGGYSIVRGRQIKLVSDREAKFQQR
jgi:hypothetical protein